MTTRTKQTIFLVSVIPAAIAGAATEWSIRAIADTPAGYIPVWVTVLTLVITNAVLTFLASVIKRNNP